MVENTTPCQSCHDVAVHRFLSLGRQPACHFPATAAEAEAEPFWPLDLGFCPRCSLVQIMAPVSERILFAGEDYHHIAGLTKGYRTHLAQLADHLATPQDDPAVRPFAIEIGSNDGSLLDELATRGFEVLGVDPCGSVSVAGSPVVKEYFGAETAAALPTTRSADIVLALNVFAHVTNVHDFLDGVRTILDGDGVFITESQYLPDLLEKLQYDFAYHEHSRYYSLTALDSALAQHDLEIFRVERIPTHGGSIRVFAGRVGRHPVEASVTTLRAHEAGLKLTDKQTYRAFARRVEEHRDRLQRLLSEVTSDGSRVAGASFPARATTLLNYCGIGPRDLVFISEISPLKIGRLSPGTHVPVVDQSQLCGPDQPEYALLLSWHIIDEVIARLRAEGFAGKFIVPLPEPRVVG